VLPLSLTTDGGGKLIRIAMADPTDTSAVVEIEQLVHCDVEVNALPLSAIDELVEKGFRQINTAVVNRPSSPGPTMFVTSRGGTAIEVESELSETAQIPVSALQSMIPDDLEAKLSALVSLLVAKGVVTEAELAEALRKAKV
jgi:hypothetical protein